VAGAALGVLPPGILLSSSSSSSVPLHRGMPQGFPSSHHGEGRVALLLPLLLRIEDRHYVFP
jgi:hypothetical protein